MESYESVACNVCDSSTSEKKLFEIRSGMLVCCTDCGLFYASPRRTASINAIIDNRTSSDTYSAKLLNNAGRTTDFTSICRTLNVLHPQKGHLLDVGCYDGLFLSIVRKHGWKCTGVEPDLGGAKYGVSKYGLDIKQTTLDNADFHDEEFDVVSMLAALEHTPNPHLVLMEIRRILKDDGLVLLTVPTIPVYLRLIRSRWRMFIGDHYYFFNDQSMRKLLAKSGFKIIHSGFVTKHVDIETITARLADEWQPNNLGKFGEILHKTVVKTGVSCWSFKINLFDTKLYIAKPAAVR